MFDQLGLIKYSKDVADEEAMLEAAVDAGADNCELEDDGHVITTNPDSFAAVRDALEQHFGEAESAKLTWHPNMTCLLYTSPSPRDRG